MIRKEIDLLSLNVRSLTSSAEMRQDCLRQLVTSDDLFNQMMLYLKVGSQRHHDAEAERFQKRRVRLLELYRCGDGASKSLIEGDISSCGKQNSDSQIESDATCIVNLSSRTFSDSETRVLNKGLNFAVAPSSVDIPEFTSSVESALMNVDSDKRSWVRSEVARCLKGFRPQYKNLDSSEQVALKSLKSMEDVIFLPADKGNSTVVLDREVYNQKLEILISEGPYRRVKFDPGSRFRKELMDLLRPLVQAGGLDRPSFLKICPTHFEPPHLFGFPKIHKQHCPLRPIISMRESLFAPLSRKLADILTSYVKGDSFIENSKDAKSRIMRSWEDVDGGDLVSLDVVSLFTNIPVEESLQVLRKLLSDDKELEHRSCFSVDLLCTLTEFCLKKCYFIFGEHFYVQTDGVAMGSSVGCVMAVIYMNYFESMALAKARVIGLPVPSLWIRYVDDVFMIFKHDRNSLTELVAFLNDLRPAIKFTTEVEENGCLPFLDMSIQKTEDGGLRFKVYRKSTHTGRYLSRDSCHPRHVFGGLVNGLKLRAENICSSSEALKEEKGYLKDVLRANGYSHNELRCLDKRCQRSDRGRSRSSASRQGCIPFIPGLSDKVKRIFQKAGSDVFLKAPSKLKTQLVRKKPSSIKRCGVVYQIKCRDCDWTYVGETGRTLAERLAEHKRSVKNCNVSASEIAAHVWETGHSIDWDKAGILASEKSYHKRVFKEAWYTRKHKAGNRVFHNLDRAWDPLF